MPARQSPTLRRRRLAQELRRLRAESGKTSTDVANQLEWAPGKLTRMERNEGKRYDPHDVRRLCAEVYEVDDVTTEYLVQLARDGRKKGWWDPYDRMLSETMSTFIGLEAEAARELTFVPLAVPGLLQTEDYAETIVRDGPAQLSADEVEIRVEIRKKRQEALFESPALEVVAVLDEAVLHRQVGSREIMQAQMEHLREVARLPNVVLQVIPFSAGAHAGMSGSFSILQFPEPTDLDAVHADLVAGQLFMEEPGEVKRYHDAFLHLVGTALSPENTLDLITNL